MRIRHVLGRRSHLKKEKKRIISAFLSNNVSTTCEQRCNGKINCLNCLSRCFGSTQTSSGDVKVTCLVFQVVSSSYRASDERAAHYWNDICKVESYISALLAWILSCMQIVLLHREILFTLLWEMGLQRSLGFVRRRQAYLNPECRHSNTFRCKDWQIALHSMTRSFRI